MPPMPDSLAILFRIDAGTALWRSDELAAILAHQLSAPLQSELALDQTYPAADIERLRLSAIPPIHTFRELLSHAAPPVDLLIAVKHFAKAREHHPDTPLPLPIATLLYFLAVLVARLGGRRITTLPDADLARAIAWALDPAQIWVDPQTQDLLRAAGAALRQPLPDSTTL